MTAVVVAYRSCGLLQQCLAALGRSTHPHLTVVVVDNGGSEPEPPGGAGPATSWVRSDRNLGFAGGVNLGIEHALETGPPADVIALVNQDCVVEPGWAEPLIERLHGDRAVAVAGARLLESDGVTLQHAGGVVHANGLTDHIGRGERDPACYREVAEVDYVTGALCAFRLEVWERFGPLDAGYFPAYYEEVDFCLRARAAGMRVEYVPDSVAVHAEASSSGRGSRLFLRRYHRNRLRFAVRHLWRPGHRAAWLAAELSWLGRLRRWDEVAPVLGAYRCVPEFRRQRGQRPSVTGEGAR